jgi:hypothetical protein
MSFAIYTICTLSADSGGQIGLAITLIMSLVGTFQYGLRQTAEVENLMISVFIKKNALIIRRIHFLINY